MSQPRCNLHSDLMGAVPLHSIIIMQATGSFEECDQNVNSARMLAGGC